MRPWSGVGAWMAVSKAAIIIARVRLERRVMAG